MSTPTTTTQWDIVSGLGLTAAAVALARAIESTREDRLIEDRFAREFVGACEFPPIAAGWPSPDDLIPDDESLWASLPAYLGVRTKVFDDVVRSATARGTRQVVLVASGLDSRAFRLQLPTDTVLYEIDMPMVLDFKQDVVVSAGLSAVCERRIVCADLRDCWGVELLRAGFDPSRPTVWIAEGLLAFLEPHVESSLLSTITALSSPGSVLGLEAAPGNDRHGVLKSRFASAEEHIGIPLEGHWQFDPRPEPLDVLNSSGWSSSIETVLAAADRYHRHLPGVMNEAARYTKLVRAELNSEPCLEDEEL